MKALVYDGPETLGFRDVPDPQPQPDEHLVRVEAVGICGSDMHAYIGHDARRPAPLILGHEAAGVVVGGPRNGDRVTINPLVSCGMCDFCKQGRENLCTDRQIISMPPREGAFAQFVSMPERNLCLVPDDVSLRQAALAEPLAVCWHAVKLALQSLHPKAARNALVLGGGAIGLGSALCLKAMGIEDITVAEPNGPRRGVLVERRGLTCVERPTGQYGIVIDAVGIEPTRAAASELALPGAVIAHIGLGDAADGLDVRRMTLQEITFIGTYTYTAQEFRDAAQALFDGRLGPLDWFDLQPLSAGAGAFADLKAGRIAVPKIVLEPWV